MQKDLYRFPDFQLFPVEISQESKQIIPKAQLLAAIQRHRTGDYGIVDLEGWDENVADSINKQNQVIGCYEYITETSTIIYYNVSTDFAKRKTKIETFDEIQEDLDFYLDLFR